MTVRRPATKPAPSGAVRFDERLSVPWWWWPHVLLIAGLVEISVRLGHPEVPAWLPMLLVTSLLAVALVRLGRQRIMVTENKSGERLLHVGPAKLPVRYVAQARAIPAKDKQATLGPNLDPTAFVLHRPWIKSLVQVTLNDPADPTPYWLFSVRRSEALLECLRTPPSS